MFGFLKIVFIFAAENNLFFIIACWRSLLVLFFKKTCEFSK